MSGYANQPWNHTPFVPPETALYGGMHVGFHVKIVHMAVGDGWVELDWLPLEGAEQYRVVAGRRGESVGFANNRPAGTPDPQILPAGVTSARFEDLVNGVDYEVSVFAQRRTASPSAGALRACSVPVCSPEPWSTISIPGIMPMPSPDAPPAAPTWSSCPPARCLPRTMCIGARPGRT